MTNHGLSFPQEELNKRVVLNGTRPSPLRVNNHSHVIQKPPFQGNLQRQNEQNPRLNPPRKPPVIIYTHSPKIIHTKPKDFMALVQKLTGFTRPRPVEEDEYHHHDKKSEKTVSSTSQEDNDSSSVSSGIDGGGDNASTAEKSPNIFPFFTDFPLFTPNSSNSLFASSPQSMLRYSDLVLTPPNVNLSPSLVEFMKRLPEY